jgi:hypothetical protein
MQRKQVITAPLAQCRRRIFFSLPDMLGYYLLVFFSSAHLSVPAGIAFDFLFLPRAYFPGDMYAQLFAYIPIRLLGLSFAIGTGLAFAAVVRIGANICGLCLPVAECMTRKTAQAYILSYFLLWLGLLGFAVFFANSGSAVGASTFFLIAVSQVIRVSIVIPKALFPK